MDALRFPQQTQMSNMLNTLQSRGEYLDEIAKKHLLRWRDIASKLELPFKIEPEIKLSAAGEILGKKFDVACQLVASGEDVFAEVLVATRDILTGERVLVESYCINSLREVFNSGLSAQITLDGVDDTSVIEYRAICESLYAVASWSSSHPRTPITSSQRVV